ncbi:MAG: hypothetical protein CO171_07870, partial [Syntrophobacterales bacterium CG_4_9_14_3_um_filter_49_8]
VTSQATILRVFGKTERFPALCADLLSMLPRYFPLTQALSLTGKNYVTVVSGERQAICDSPKMMLP